MGLIHINLRVILRTIYNFPHTTLLLSTILLSIDYMKSQLNMLSHIFFLPGNRDRGGRPVLQVCTRAQVWASETCTVSDVTCLLGYYHSTLRYVARVWVISLLNLTRQLYQLQMKIHCLFTNWLFCSSCSCYCLSISVVIEFRYLHL